MARTGFTGFGARSSLIDLNAATIPSPLSYETTIVRTGAASLKITATSGVSIGGAGSLPGGTSGTYFRAYVRVTALPATARSLFGVNASGHGIRLNPSGTLSYLNQAGVVIGTSTTALTDTSRWYRVEWRVGTGTSVPILVIDGTTEASATISGIVYGGTVGPNDTVAAAYTAYVADWAADNAGFPGDGKVVILLPTSDNSVGTGWTNSAGTTTNLWDCVDNTPPIGVADTTANAGKQIRNASSLNQYIAQCPALSTLLGASDTVHAVQSFVVVGAPVTTGAKTGSQQLSAAGNLSAGVATSFAANSGTYWTGTAAGAYPTGWKVEKSTITSVEAAADNLAATPFLSLNIGGGTASRIALCCAMGAYIDFSPGVPNITTSVAQGRASTTTGTVSLSLDTGAVQGRSGSSTGTVQNNLASSLVQGRSSSTTGTVVTPSADISSIVQHDRSGAVTAATVQHDLVSSSTQGRASAATLSVLNNLATALAQGRTATTVLTAAADLSSVLAQGRAAATALTAATDIQSSLQQGRPGSVAGTVSLAGASSLAQGRTSSTVLAAAADLVSALAQGRGGSTVLTATASLVSALAQGRSGSVTITVAADVSSSQPQGRSSVTVLTVPALLATDLAQGRSSATTVRALSDLSSTLAQGRSGSASGTVLVSITGVTQQGRSSLTLLLVDDDIIDVNASSVHGRGGVTTGTVLVQLDSAQAQGRSAQTTLQALSDLLSVGVHGRGASTQLAVLSSLVTDVLQERVGTMDGTVLVQAASDLAQGRDASTALSMMANIVSDALQGRTSLTELTRAEIVDDIIMVGSLHGVNLTPVIQWLNLTPTLTWDVLTAQLIPVDLLAALHHVPLTPALQPVDLKPRLIPG